MSDERVLQAERWIIEHQNDDGGWGESCASYMELELAGKGVSTASQTAWALMALLTADNLHSADAIRRGLDFLTRTQQDDSWDEPYSQAPAFLATVLVRVLRMLKRPERCNMLRGRN